MNRYRALTPHAEQVYQPGVFELDLSPSAEADLLASGLAALEPRTYKVLSRNYEAGEQGDTFDGTFLVEVEAALIAGGHIERVDEKKAKPTPKPAKASASSTKEK